MILIRSSAGLSGFKSYWLYTSQYLNSCTSLHLYLHWAKSTLCSTARGSWGGSPSVPALPVSSPHDFQSGLLNEVYSVMPFFCLRSFPGPANPHDGPQVPAWPPFPTGTNSSCSLPPRHIPSLALEVLWPIKPFPHSGSLCRLFPLPGGLFPELSPG